MESAIKNCRWCCQDIPMPARRCPHCTSMQGLRGSVVVAWIIGILYILALALVVSYFNGFSSGPNYADKVSISDSKKVFSKHQGDPTVAVIGMLQNNATLDLDHIQLEAQFLDKDGELLDVGSKGMYGYAIPASGEVAFKVLVNAAQPEEDYGSTKVFVRSAEDASAFP